MVDNEFKIALGVELDPDKISATINNQINKAKINPIQLTIDPDIKDQLNAIKQQVKDINKTGSNNKNLLPVSSTDLTKVSNAFEKLDKFIDEIKISFGSLGEDVNMKPLLVSINEISSALSEVSKQFKELSSSFNGFNLNLSLGGSKNPIAANAAYGKKARTDTIPQLKEQFNYLQDLLGGQEKIISQFLRNMNQFNGVDMFAKVQQMLGDMDDPSLAKQMEAYRQYIDYMKKLAKINNVDLGGFNSKFSKSADELIDTTRKIQTGETDAEESMQRLQKIFGGSSNVDLSGFTTQLDLIIQKLEDIGKAITDLSSGISIDGLTESFDNLSTSINQIGTTLENLSKKVKSFNVELANSRNVDTGASDKIEKASDSSAAIVVRNEENKQQAYLNTAKVYDKISRDASLVRDNTSFKQIFYPSNQAAQEAKKHFQELLADEKAVVSVTEQFDDSNALQSFTVNIKRASGEVETLRYAMENLSNVEDREDWFLTYQGASANDKNVEKQLDKHIKKANDLQIKLDKIKSEYNDAGHAKPIKKSDHIASLDKQYKKVKKAITDVRNADDSAFLSMVSNAEKEKAALENMVRKYRNAETVATSLRSKDINTVKAAYDSKLDVLISKMRKDGVYTSGFESGAENLRSILSNATDSSGLVKFLNGLDKLDAGYKRASASAKEFNQTQKVGINVSGLESKIADLQRISPEIDKFEAEINGAKVSIQSLLNDLKEVNTQGDFSVINSKFKAFTDSAKAAGIAITENTSKTKDAYDELINKIKEIGSIQVELTGLDSEKDANKIKALKDRLIELNVEYDKLHSTFSQSFNPNQVNGLNEAWDEVTHKVNVADSELADATAFKQLQAEAKQTASEIRKLFDVVDKIDKLEVDIAKLNDESNANEIVELQTQLSNVRKAYQELMTSLQGKLSTEQLEKLGAKVFETQDKINWLTAKMTDKSILEQHKKQVQQTKNAYDKLINTIKEMGSTRAKLSVLDPKTDAKKIDFLTSKLNQLQAEFDETYSASSKSFSAEQLNDLSKALNETFDKIDFVEAGISDSLDKKAKQLQDKIQKAKAELALKVEDKFSVGDFDDDDSKIHDTFNKIKNKTKDAIDATKEFEIALKQLKSAIATEDVDSIVSSYARYENALKRVNNYLDINKRADTSITKEQKESIKQTAKELDNLSKTAKEMESLELEIGKLKIAGGKENEIKALEATLKSVREEYDKLIASFNFNDPNLTIDDFAKLNAIFEKTQSKLAQFEGKAKDVKAKLAEKIKESIKSDDLDVDSSNINKKLDGIENKSKELTKAVQEYNVALEEVKRNQNSANPDDLINSWNNYKNALERLNNQLKINKNAQDQANAALKLQTDKDAFSSKINIWLNKNSAAIKQFGSQIEDIKDRIQSCDKVQLDNLEAEFKEVTRQAELAGVAGLSLGDKLKKQFGQYGAYLSVASMFSYVEQALRAMYDNVIAIDSAMTDLMKVTDETDAAYDRFLTNAGQKAQELGRSVSSFIQQSAEWAKMGYDAVESAELAKVSSVYANVADVDDATAVSDIVTAMKAFNIEAENAISIIDPMNKLSNEFAVTAAGLGQGLSRAASTMATSGTDLEHTLALLTGISEITQSPEEAGNFLKTAIARIQGMKGELEELGEEVDESVDSISKVQTQILNLTSGTSKAVNIFDDNGEFRDYYDIMQDIASIVDELESTERAQLYEILFGKNRMNQGAAMIQAFQSGRIGEALESALKAEGSAMAEQEKWMESLEAKLGQLEAAFESLSKTVLNSDLLKTGIDFLTGVVNLLDKIVNTLGGLGTVGAGIAIFSVFKNKDLINNVTSFSKALFGAKTTFDELMTSSDNLTASFKSFAKSPAGVATAIGLITTVISTAIQLYQNYKQELRETESANLSAAQEAIETADAFEDAYIKLDKFDGKINLSATEQEEFVVAVKSANEALGDNAIAFDTASGSAQEYLETLKGITAEELNQAKINATKQRQAAENLLKGTSWDWWGGSQITIDLSGRTGIDEFIKAKDILNKYMADYIDIGTYGEELEPLNWDSDHTNMDAVVDYYYQLIALTDELADKKLTENDIYNDSMSIIKMLKTDVDSYVAAKYDELKYEYEAANGIPTEIEGYKKLSDYMLNAVGSSEQLKNAMENMLKEDFGSVIDLSSLENTVNEVVQYTEEQKQKVINSFGSVSGKALTDSAKEAYRAYKEEIDKLNQLGFDPSQTVFGNIDTNNRQVLEWTENSLNQYKEALESWYQDMSWDEIVGDFYGSSSTVLGTSNEFDGVEIAFSPMLQTENGAVLLDSNTVYEYIWGLIDKAGEGWTSEDLLRLDAEGLEFDGQVIKGLLADIGETAIQTGQAMHFTGADGSIAQIIKPIEEAAKDANVSVDELLNSLSNNEKIQNWFDELTPDEQDLVYKIGISTDASASYTLEQWEQALIDMREAGVTTEKSLQAFYDIMNDDEDGNFSETVNGYKEDIDELNDALTKLDSGELTKDEILDLANTHHELIGATDDVNVFRQALINLIDAKRQSVDSKFEEELNNVGGAATTAGKKLLAYKDIVLDTISDESSNVGKLSFRELITDDSKKDNEFIDRVNTYIEKVGTLQDVLKSIKEDDFTESDFAEFAMEFPELADDADNLEEAISVLLDTMNTDMVYDFSNQFGRLEIEEDVKALRNFMNTVLKLGKVVGDTAISIDISAESEGMESLFAAIKESLSSTGLTAESIDNLKKRYKDLEGYDPARLFEETTNGIRLNTDALNDLEDAYQKQTKTKLDNRLKALKYQYNALSDEIKTCDDVARKAELYAQQKNIVTQINEVATLASQYNGLTSAYYKWEQAQSAGSDRDMYEGIISGREELEEEMSRGWLDDDSIAYLELLTGLDLSSSTTSITDQIAAYKELSKTINSAGYNVWDFFTYDKDGNSTSEGVYNFFDTVRKEFGDTAAWVDKNGNYNFDFETVGGDEVVAEALGISEELVQIILRAAEDAGFKINLESSLTELADLKTSAEEANDALINVGKTDIDFNFDTTDTDVLKKQIDDAQTLLNNLVGTDGTLNVDVSEEDYENAKIILATLISQKQQLNAPSIMSVNTEQAKTDIESAIALLKDYQTNYNNLEINAAVGADTSGLETDIQTKITEIQGLSPEIKASLGLDDGAFITACENVVANITAGVTPNQEDLVVINDTISAITPEMMVKAGLDASLIEEYQESEHTTEGEVIWDNDTTKVDDYSRERKYAYGEVIWKNNTSSVKTSFVANGTISPIAKVNGTAYAQGNWGTKDSGVALGGELGRETVVRDGRFFTIGDNGAEFFQYKKDDIIFNHKQTEELFKYGKITSGGGRGRAFVEGTAFKTGSNGTGGGRITINGSVSTNGNSGDSDSSSSSADEFLETFDWIEVAIDRIERAISRLDTKVNSTYRSWSSRNDNLKKEISKVGEEIDLQQRGYDRYIQQANSVGLDESWAKKVRDGKVDIETITDEELAEKIGEYQTWYEKALDCNDAILELKETQAELYETAFNHIVTQYEGFLSVIEHERNMLEEYISQSEASGHIVSTKYYDALINVEKANIDKLEKEKEALLTSLEEAVNSGTIKPDSEAWFEMCNQIDEVTQSITEANTSLIEMNNSIRDIEWSIFDMLQEQISNVAEEADFLIDLLSNDKLYDDRGQLTDEGMSTMGLHGMNYNVYMAQADKYAEEMLEINKKLADDPYNQELIERRQELLELQQDMIIAAEDEKQAIVDMVKEGIELELDALQELIDSYTEALDSQKDLYDYQKKIKDQVSEIASLEKQMSAYQGDNSEETKSKIQQIKVSLEEARENLEETEYDKYISDQKQLLDELFIEYETILNQRLDNIDLLISDMIAEINTSASTINETLLSKADEVGYTLSDSMKTTWDTSTSNITTVLTTYGQGIQDGVSTLNGSILSASTTLNTALTTLDTNIQNMMSKLNTSASNKVQSATTSSAVYSQQAQSNTYTPSTAINANTSSSSSSTSSSSSSSSSPSKKDNSDKKSNSSKKSDSSNKSKSNSSKSNDNIFDYKKDSYPKDKLNVNTSVVDRLKYNNFDSSYSARKDYYGELGFSGTYTGSDKQNIQILNAMKKMGYKQGHYKLSKDELAWTQEGRKTEAIIRPSDGAILTPLAKDDSILKASATSNMFSFFNDPSTFIRDNLNVASSISNAPAQNVVGGTYDNDFNMQVVLPNVTNYEQFKHEMQHDKNFENMIRAMTVDKMFGGSSLKKYKY